MKHPTGPHFGPTWQTALLKLREGWADGSITTCPYCGHPMPPVTSSVDKQHSTGVTESLTTSRGAT